jgi:hypothetical protein
VRYSRVLGGVALATGCASPDARGYAQTLPDSAVAFVNVSVLPMDRERVLTGQTVIVRRGAITDVGPADRVTVPDAATRVDGQGKYLMPGLADLHVHFGGPRDMQLALLKLYVANGVTTVLNLRGSSDQLALRKDVAEGKVLGPTIYTAGPYVNEPFVTTPDEVERAVVDLKRSGYDFAKMHGDLSREAYRRLHAVGRREGIRVIGHAPRNLGIEAMFEERQYAVVHAEEYIYDRNNSSRHFAQIEPRIPELARATVNAGIWVMPNLTAYKNIGAQINDLDAILARPEMAHMPPGIRESWGPATNPYTRRFGKDLYPGFLERYAMLEKLVRGFRAAGVKMLVGTDALNTAVVPGSSMHDELADLVAAGLTSYEALRAATANAAEFFAVSGRNGTVAVGQPGDLVLLEANPLENVANTRRIAGVMLRGRWMSQAEIGTMLEALMQSYAR